MFEVSNSMIVRRSEMKVASESRNSFLRGQFDETMDVSGGARHEYGLGPSDHWRRDLVDIGA